MVLRMLPDKNERLLQGEESALMLNAAALRTLSEPEIRKAVRSTFDDASTIASNAGKRLVPTIDFRAFTKDMLPLLPNRELGDDTIRTLLSIIAAYRARWRLTRGNEIWREGPQYPQYDIQEHPALARYGNVELRVVENFLLAPDDLRSAIGKIAGKLSSEPEMYATSNASGNLMHDDPDWNIRRLMTNAGFYMGSEPDRAWESLEDWARRYISAVCNSHLSWSNTKSLFFQRTQRALNEKSRFVPKYVESPGVRRIYDNIKGREVLFVSPLAHIVNEQASSGRLWKLYKDYEVPSFSVRAIPAWISTWPNRPHSDWSETFARMRESVHAAYNERPFDVFISACGCYGLPISDFVRTQYGCSTLYIGHQTHKLFGILPVSSDRINVEMWAKSDLGKYANMDRIDRGRYLNTGRH
jgi:hypothetical protein